MPFPKELRAENLLLRSLMEEDWQLEYDLSRVPDVPQWTYYPPDLDEPGARRRISRTKERQEARLAARYAIVIDGRAIGTVGIGWRDGGAPEIFYALISAGRGRGAATESVRLLTTWLFDHGFTAVALETVAGNTASEKVAERAGFRQTDSYLGYQGGESVQVNRWLRHSAPLV
ncbi:RimJ/RimL family protein N-acetyltransferase [Arthrobacter sp. CAN_A212]|uniref:GNAT family N-acetyltransferase n=1 Tax=Arthrobacter sp. CAN_A212 TaxID=2787719 RepID=UPI0018C99005